MKNFIRMLALFIIMIIMMIASMNIYTKDAKTKETRAALSQSMEQAVSNLTLSDLKLANESDLADYFVAQLSSSITSVNKGIDVKIYGINYTEGYIDAEATAYFNYVLGNSSVTVRKTIYLDETSDEQKVGELKTQSQNEQDEAIVLKSVNVSSSIKEHSAKLINDDEKGTYWESEFDETDLDVNKQNVTVDLGKVYNINALKINWGENYAKHYAIKTSLDKKKWSVAYETDMGQGQNESLKFDTKACRYVQISLISKAVQDKGYQIKKIQIFPEYENVKIKKEKSENDNKLLSTNCFITSDDKNKDTIKNIIDGNDETVWNSDSNSNLTFMIDLGSNYDISNINIVWNSESKPMYTLLYSKDNKTWETYYDSTSDEKISTSCVARYIKFVGLNSNSDNYSIREFKVFGKSTL